MKRRFPSMVTLLLACVLAPVAAHADMRVQDAWARATPPGMDKGAGYLTIHNDGDSARRLTGARFEPAERVEIHRSSEQDGQMRMQAVDDGVSIPAGESVTLEPMGYHLMLIGLDKPLGKGDEHQLTLEFSNGDTVSTSLKVRSANHGKGASGQNH